MDCEEMKKMLEEICGGGVLQRNGYTDPISVVASEIKKMNCIMLSGHIHQYCVSMSRKNSSNRFVQKACGTYSKY